MTLTNVDIASQESVNAVFSFSSTGSIILAQPSTVKFRVVTVKSASIQLNLEADSSEKSSDAAICGDVQFEALETNVAVHLYSSAPGVIPRRT